jgi:hypothetical protein
METMLGISLYSYPSFKLAKTLVILIFAYVFSSIKLEKRAEQVLPGSEEVGGKKKEVLDMGEKWPICTCA